MAAKKIRILRGEILRRPDKAILVENQDLFLRVRGSRSKSVKVVKYIWSITFEITFEKGWFFPKKEVQEITLVSDLGHVWIDPNTGVVVKESLSSLLKEKLDCWVNKVELAGFVFDRAIGDSSKQISKEEAVDPQTEPEEKTSAPQKNDRRTTLPRLRPVKRSDVFLATDGRPSWATLLEKRIAGLSDGESFAEAGSLARHVLDLLVASDLRPRRVDTVGDDCLSYLFLRDGDEATIHCHDDGEIVVCLSPRDANPTATTYDGASSRQFHAALDRLVQSYGSKLV